MRILSLMLLLTAVLFAVGCDGEEDDSFEPVYPVGIVPINGEYYKLNPGDTSLTPPLRFKVVDNDGSAMSGHRLDFTLVEGDGILSTDTATVGNELFVELGYAFSDSVGHAIIKVTSGSLDSTEVVLRKSMLIPGTNRQGQFLQFTDTWATVKAFNGEPDLLIVDPDYFRFHAVYEQSLGVVFIIEDKDEDDIVDDNEAILEIIVNDNEDSNPDNNYKGTTKDGIGIGSIFADVVASLGSPADTATDFEFPPYWRYQWPSLGLTVYTTYNANRLLRDSLNVREIHLFKPELLPLLAPKRGGRLLSRGGA